jgi:hypothetical protein
MNEPSLLHRMIDLLDQATMRAGNFANRDIRVVRRDEAEAILRRALAAPIKPLFTEASLFADLKGWCAETFGGVWGVSRVADNDQAVLVSFRRRLTDDELRDFHDALAGRPAKG